MNNADWWAKKLGQQQLPPRADITPPMPPSQQPMAPMPAFQVNQEEQQKLARLAPSSQKNDYCPDCGSSNFMAPTLQIAPRCYDCGYPIQQSGSRFGSLAGAHVEGTTQAAKGNDTTNNWNPQGIIGHV